MILQVLVWVLLVCLGVLLGTTWTTQAFAPDVHQQTEERRKRDEQWAAALRTTRQRRGQCPHCGAPLSE